MRQDHPFTAADLAELDERLLARASAVVALEDVHRGNRATSVIGMRHDVDARHALATAVRIAEWEAERGYRSTFFILHTSPYWNARGFRESLDRIAACGHEIGIHTNALAEAMRTGRDPDLILDEAIATLRGMGFPVIGVAGHGDPFCNRDRGYNEPTFANDEQFVECARPKEGDPDRVITRGKVALKLRPRPLADFGLEYEAIVLGLPHPWRTSDSGGSWLHPFDEVVAEFEDARRVEQWVAQKAPQVFRQLHLLWHPDWWSSAFARQAVTA